MSSSAETARPIKQLLVDGGAGNAVRLRRRGLAQHARRQHDDLGAQTRRLIGVDHARRVLFRRAPRDELLQAEHRLFARREVDQRLPAALDAEEPSHELGQRARDRDQKLGLVGRTQLRAGAIGFEPFGQRRILRGQRSTETRVERRQRRRIVKIRVAHPRKAEGEVTVGARRRRSSAPRKSEGGSRSILINGRCRTPGNR